MKYRPDIDGLRAVAVLPVVLHHAGVPGPSGGFVGVDVFFVISGFLITSIVAGELAEGRFSLVHFYERRCRRILPALVAVIIATFVVGWFVLLPAEFEDLGESALASALFLSNVYFTLKLDYFARAAEFAPLLHLWSLAVEEQFYLFFPPLLMLLFAFLGRRAALCVVLLLSVLSIGAAAAFLSPHPEMVFYLIFFRAWELGLGAALALARLPAPRNLAMREALGAAGLIAILAPVFVYDSEMLFPGIAALPPVLGTVLLIHVGAQGGGSVVSTLLSHRLPVWVGLISYSLYLWHWPILAFLRIVLGTTALPLALGIFAVAVSTAVAWMSWRFIERPFRIRPPDGLDRRGVFRASAASIAAIVVVGGVLYQSDGLPARLPAETLAIAAVADDFSTRRAECFGVLPKDGLCTIGASPRDGAAMDFLFWGDSHANAFRPGVSLAAKDAGQAGLFAGERGCLPIREIRRVRDRRSCYALIEGVWDFLEARTDMPVVVLGARWPLAVEGTRYEIEGGGSVRLRWVGAPKSRPVGRKNAELFEAGLRATVEALRATGRKVVLLGSIPESHFDVPAVLARANMLGWSPARSISAAANAIRTGRSEEILRRIAEDHEGVRYLPLMDLFCDSKVCRVTNSAGLPLYVDAEHISRGAAITVLRARIAEIWGPDFFPGEEP